MNQRVTIFIDGSNLFHILKAHFGNSKIDFSKLGEHLANGRHLVRTYYYTSPTSSKNGEKYKKQQNFFETIRKLDYFELVLGGLEKRIVKIKYDYLKEKYGEEAAKTVISIYGNKLEYYVEKGVDVRIAVDMVELAYKNSYDTAILVSADGDFSRAVQAVKDMGKHVEVASAKKSFSYHLRNECDKCIHIDEFIAECFL